MSKQIVRVWIFLAVATGLFATACLAQEAQREPAKAPYADALVRQEMAAHLEIVFLGLRVSPPGKTHHLIVACSNSESAPRR